MPTTSVTYSTSEIRKKIFDLPKDKIKEEDYKSVKNYLEKLKSEFCMLAGQLDKNNFHHFKGMGSINFENRKESFVKDLEDRIDKFNGCCVKAVTPLYASVANPFKALFFDDNEKCADEEVFIKSIEKGCHFFRIRKADKDYQVFKEIDLYLIKSSLSSKISLARFNLSGYPCLYLAESLYLAWEECRRPDFYNANFVRFTNTRRLKVFCLTIPDQLNSVAAFFRAYLSLVCSAKSNDDDKDHWQYHISNLFIQMLSQLERKDIDGIKYLSSRRFEKEDYRMDYSRESAAYVFPPKDIEVEHCGRLASMFSMTKPYSYFFFKMHSLSFRSTRTAITHDYEDTIFAFLERQLIAEPTTPCGEIIKGNKT